MAVTLVQTKTFQTAGYESSVSFSFDSSVTSGNMIFIALYHGGVTSIDTISDTTNTYNLLSDSADGPAYADGSAFYAYNVTGGSLTITLDFNPGYPNAVGIAREYSGLTTTDPLDVKADHSDGEYTFNHSTGTTSATTQSNELVIAWHISDQSAASHTIADFSNKIEANNGTWGETVIADKITTSTGTQTATFVSDTYSNSWSGIATFKDASPPPPAEYGDMLLMFM